MIGRGPGRGSASCLALRCTRNQEKAKHERPAGQRCESRQHDHRDLSVILRWLEPADADESMCESPGLARRCWLSALETRATKPLNPVRGVSGSDRHCALAFATAFLMRLTCPRPRPFTSQPSSKYRLIIASSSIPKQSMIAQGLPTLYHCVGFEVQVLLVPHGEHDCIRALEGGVEVLAHPQVLELLLVSEETSPAVADGRDRCPATRIPTSAPHRGRARGSCRPSR